MKKIIIAALGIVAYVGGLVGVYYVAQHSPIGMLDYQPAAWGALGLSLLGLGTVVKVRVS